MPGGRTPAASAAPAALARSSPRPAKAGRARLRLLVTSRENPAPAVNSQSTSTTMAILTPFGRPESTRATWAADDRRRERGTITSAGLGGGSVALDDVDDGEDDAHGTQSGQGQEGDRLGVGGYVPERAERGGPGQPPGQVEVERAERGHADEQAELVHRDDHPGRVRGQFDRHA